MKKKVQFKKGDKVISYGRIYQVFKIKKEEVKKGKKDQVVYLKPYFQTRRNKSLVYSIPLGHVDKTRLRRPLCQKELNRLFKRLAKKPRSQKSVNISRLKDILTSNDAFETAQVLRVLWADKLDQSTNFTASKQKVFKSALKKLDQEVSLVKKISRKEGRKKIKQALKKMKKK